MFYAAFIVKGKIKQRDDARLLFDAAQDSHAKLTEKNKEQFKIDKAAADVEVAQSKYERVTSRKAYWYFFQFGKEITSFFLKKAE